MKKTKNTWKYNHFTHVYQKLWSNDVRFLRYGAQRMDVDTYRQVPHLSKTNQLNPNQLVAIKVESIHKPVMLMSCYETPKQTCSELSFEEIKRLLNKYKHNPKWIDGDFTLTNTNWETSSVSKNFSRHTKKSNCKWF